MVNQQALVSRLTANMTDSVAWLHAFSQRMVGDFYVQHPLRETCSFAWIG